MKKMYEIWQLIVFLSLFLNLEADAQKQTHHWFFGTMAGLDFNTTPPTVLANSMVNSNEGTASMSDANGNLLFYTDGVSIWDNTHAVMPNGSGLAGDVSTTQSALIVKRPASTTLYYVFTLPAEGLGSFCYSVVDMSLASGKGDVTTKNTVLKNNVTEKMSATYHCNGTDIWVTIHEAGSNAFYSYLVSSVGISPPVLSTTGRVFTRVHGQMKFNTKGTMLAVTRDTVTQTAPYLGISYIDVCRFNNMTGAVNYSFSLVNGNWQKGYGLEFSSDNTKLYVSVYDQGGVNSDKSEVLQYNLAAPNVQASGVTVGSHQSETQHLRALQLASDGKIYVVKSISPFLCVINTPNAPGTLCGFANDVINVDPNQVGSACMLGLPGFIQNYVDPSFPVIEACSTTVGIKEKTTQSPSVFYDHQRNVLTVLKTSGDTISEIRITDLQGKIILERADGFTEGERLNFRLNDVSPGLYFVTIRSGVSICTAKFIKPE